MYRPEEVTMILEQAKQYTDSQKLWRTERKTLAFDGNPEGKESQPIEVNGNAAVMVRVSDSPVKFTKEKIKKLSWLFAGQTVHDLSGISVVEHDATIPGRIVMFTDPDGATYQLVMVVDQDLTMGEMTLSKGVYFLYVDDHSYTSLLEIEIITPIPQEYIPPLDRLILNGADGNQYALTITDGALSVAPVTT